MAQMVKVKKGEETKLPLSGRDELGSGSNGLEGQIALLVDDASEAILATAKDQIGGKIRLPQRVAVRRRAEDPRGGSGRGRSTTHGPAVATTDGLKLLGSKESELSHDQEIND
ncbi:MAG: hypothetical protein FJ060_02970 [Cyanobacteria bacterium K_Offshore_0m_m2_072]|nr:hypothetical protein [Cyanobacteria bacterium K_Offshore_0m_m2_072]